MDVGNDFKLKQRLAECRVNQLAHTATEKQPMNEMRLGQRFWWPYKSVTKR